MTVAVVCTTILALALLGALIALSMAHARERQELIDRLQSPAASQVAAVERLMPKPEPVPEPAPVYVPTTDPDLIFLQEN